MDAYLSSRGLFTSFSLLLVLLGTLVGQIFASPLPLSADTAMLHEHNSSNEISSSNFNFSLLNWEHSDSEVAPLNERGLFGDELFVGVGVVKRVSYC